MPEDQQYHVVASDTRMLPPDSANYSMRMSMRVAKGVFEMTFLCSYPFSSYDDPEIVEVSATYKFRYERATIALIGAEVTAARRRQNGMNA